MFTFPLTWVFYVLQTLTLSEFVNANSVNDLPLVLIQEEKKFVYPNKLDKTVFEANRGFTGETKFAQDTNTNQVFFCPADKKKRKKYIVGSNFLFYLGDYYSNHRVGSYCLFEKTFKPNEVITCTEEAIPGIYKHQVGHFFDQNGYIFVTKNDQTCGRNGNGTRYKFAYELCFDINKWDKFKNSHNHDLSEVQRYVYKIMNMFLITQPVYEICYDNHSKETLHTKHELPAIQLLQNQNLSHEQEKKSDKIDDYIYNNSELNFKKDIKFYEEMPPWYKQQLLVPPDDMMTALLKKTTNHYINIKPMHEEIIKLWNFMENFLRSNLKEPSTPYEIYTGAFKISAESKKNRIPDFWIKVLFRRDKEDFKLSQSVAIVLRNEYKEGKQYTDTTMTDFCEEDACQIIKDRDSEIKAKFSKLFEHVRCCPVNKMIKNLFQENLNEGVLLPIVRY
ncbi:uncharacterized protein LOC135835626 [Planococcus citri]|uniref:uncharacterized protein LOC135835626 n=1 Tax=Planococcus citri TaxID=170843 RepID=UPI0031F78010